MLHLETRLLAAKPGLRVHLLDRLGWVEQSGASSDGAGDGRSRCSQLSRRGFAHRVPSGQSFSRCPLIIFNLLFFCSYYIFRYVCSVFQVILFNLPRSSGSSVREAAALQNRATRRSLPGPLTSHGRVACRGYRRGPDGTKAVRLAPGPRSGTN